MSEAKRQNYPLKIRQLPNEGKLVKAADIESDLDRAIEIIIALPTLQRYGGAEEGLQAAREALARIKAVLAG